MKKFWSIFLAVVLCMTMVAIPCLAEEGAEEGAEGEYYSQDFQLKNSTNVEIQALYISPNEEESWSENCLAEPFASGTIVNVTFDVVATEGYLWDLRCEDSEGTGLNFFGLSLAEVKAIELTYDAEAQVGTATCLKTEFEAAAE